MKTKTNTITKGEFVKLTRNLPKDNCFISADGKYSIRLKVAKSALTKKPVVYGRKLNAMGLTTTAHPFLDIDKYNNIKSIEVCKSLDANDKEVLTGITLNYKYNRKSVNLVSKQVLQGLFA